MKVGIVTIYGLNNYGNRLQNYAVYSTLNRFRIEADTLVPLQISKHPMVVKKEAEVRRLYSVDPVKAQETEPYLVRELRFKNFNYDNIPEKYLTTTNIPSSISDEYDYFVTGSDQVWNPLFKSSTGKMDDYFLSFAPPEKRVCFSPSIGLDDLPDKWKPLFSEELNKFRHLSVREESGAALITSLTGKHASVLLDPTLMIDRTEWLSIAKPLDGLDYNNGNYILYYFLGDKDEEMSDEMKTAINREIEEHDLLEYKFLDKENPALFSAGPAEFIHLINNAKLVVTDSFHATVFSILLGRPFLICNRNLTVNGQIVDMSNRITTLLKKFNLGHKLPGVQKLDSDSIWDHNYSKATPILAKERRKVNKFLKQSFRKDE